MFPNKEEKQKALINENNYKLFKGFFDEVLNHFRTAEDRQNKREIIINMCETISTVFADLLFLEEPDFFFSDDNIGEKLEEIVIRNDFKVKLWDAAISQSWGGRAIFEVRLEDGEAMIEEISPDVVFPQYNKTNIKAPPLQIIFAWYVKILDKNYLLKKVHNVGFIEYELWLCESKRGDPKFRVPLSLYDPNLQEIEQTGLDKIPVFMANNPKDPKSLDGVSDYQGLYSLLEELTRVSSQIATQLEKHADAKLMVPSGVLDQNGQAQNSNLEMIEIDSDDGMTPEYLTNSNSLIDSAFKQKKEIIEDIARVSEISFILLDLASAGGVQKDETFAESAARTMAKVKRKRKTFVKLIRETLAFSYEIETKKKIPLSGIAVKFHDGLPENQARKVQIEADRMAAGIQSRRDAVKNLDNIDGEILDDKIEEIEKQEDSLVNTAF